jgi:hypothetical protein
MTTHPAVADLVPDRAYTVELLTKLNALTSNGKLLHEYFVYGPYSLWSMQQFYLFTQIEAFSKTKNVDAYTAELTPRYGLASYLFLGFFDVVVVLVSLVGVIGARLTKPYALTFSSDFLNASPVPNPRLRNIHTYLIDNKIPYAELFHITTVQAFFRNITTYRRFGIYREAVVVVAQLKTFWYARARARRFLATIDLSAFSPVEQRFLRLLILKTAERAEETRASIPIFRYLFQFLNVRTYLSVDDFRYIAELMVACEEAHIPSHVFQHSNFGFLTGLFTLTPSVYPFPTKYYTWNSYWLKRVQEISPFFATHASRMQVGGRSYTPVAQPTITRSLVPGEKSPLTILVPYEVTTSADQVQPYMAALLADERIRVLFMLRGSIEQINYQMQITKYIPESERTNSRLVVMESSKRKEALESCDLVGGVYSGFLDETLEAGLPVCIFKTDFISVNRLDSDGLATLIDVTKGSVYNQLLSAYHTPDNVLRERRERVNAGAVDINETLTSIVRS